MIEVSTVPGDGHPPCTGGTTRTSGQPSPRDLLPQRSPPCTGGTTRRRRASTSTSGSGRNGARPVRAGRPTDRRPRLPAPPPAATEPALYGRDDRATPRSTAPATPSPQRSPPCTGGT